MAKCLACRKPWVCTPNLGVVVHIYTIPAFMRWRQEGHKFQASSTAQRLPGLQETLVSRKKTLTLQCEDKKEKKLTIQQNHKLWNLGMKEKACKRQAGRHHGRCLSSLHSGSRSRPPRVIHSETVSTQTTIQQHTYTEAHTKHEKKRMYVNNLYILHHEKKKSCSKMWLVNYITRKKP